MLRGSGLLAITVAVVGSAPAALALLQLEGTLEPGFGPYNALLLVSGFAALAGARMAGQLEAWDGATSWWRQLWVRRVAATRLLVVSLQLGLLLLVIRQFQIENPVFTDAVIPLVVGGFLIHSLTPLAFRPKIFLLLSLSAITIALGIYNGAWLVAVGVSLVGLAHLPLAFRWRVALLLAAGAGLAVLRASEAAVPWSRAVWPILGSMFMFRLIVYVHDLRQVRKPVALSQRLSYFLMLPNVVFPLFPVVDWETYCRTYYDDEAHRVYQRGVEWMLRGVVHLLIYRAIYQYVTLPADQVANPADLGHHMLGNILLYVRVSGQFHLVVGILHLFGFHLPETHRRYFLAPSFTEFWRRINIYWKDFMMKVLYYPVYFPLRRVGHRVALLVATLLVFVATWALHSYQWFWLVGSFPITWPDILFWGGLALLLVANALREHRHGRSRSLRAESLTLRLVLQTAGTFVVMCILWSLWMSPTVGAWVAMCAVALQGSDLGSLSVLALGLLGLTAVIAGALALARARGSAVGGNRPFVASALGTSVALLALLLVGSAPVKNGGALAVLRERGLNQDDVAQLQRGYYEDLMGVTRFNSQLWEVYMRRPPKRDWPMIWDTPAGHLTGDFLKQELRPNVTINYLGQVLTTNRWAMRDGDYDRVKPPGTVRLALMGASIEMGWGVADGEPFEAVAEARLNEAPPGRLASRYEVLNFAIPSYKLPQQLMIVDRVLSFEPDVLLLATHAIDAGETAIHLAERLEAGIKAPVPFLAEVVREVGADTLDPFRAVQALNARSDELVTWMYREIASRAKRAGAHPVLVLVPMAERALPGDPKAVAHLARATGLEVIDLRPAYRGQDLPTLQLRLFDGHPNARGHELLGERLYETLLAALPRWIGARVP